MKAEELSRKYATAIFDQALEKWLVTLSVVQNALTNEPDTLAKLADTSRAFAQRQKELDRLIPEGTEQPIRNFLYTMLQSDDVGLLKEVTAELERMSRGGPQVQVARVTTAIEMGEEDREQFRQKLRAKYGQDLEFVFNVDPDIIGGAIVRIGDRVIDGSVAARLEAMGNALGVKR